MIDKLFEVDSRLLRKFGSILSKMGFGRVALFVDIYRTILNRILPRGRRELSVNGCRMVARLGGGDSFDDIGVALMFEGKYEPQTTEFFKGLIKPGMRVVDVGANIGYYTLLAANLVGFEGKVWAFEPEGENFADLSENTFLNNFRNVVLSQKAVSDEDGETKLYLSKDSGGHSLVKNRRLDSTKAVEVEVVRLDSVIKESVDILKTDTEGNEIAVLRGAKGLFEYNSNIKLFVEFQLELFGESYVDELVGLLADYGFKHLYVLDDLEMSVRGIDPQELKRDKRRRKYAPNILCSKTVVRGY